MTTEKRAVIGPGLIPARNRQSFRGLLAVAGADSFLAAQCPTNCRSISEHMTSHEATARRINIAQTGRQQSSRPNLGRRHRLTTSGQLADHHALE